MKAIKCSIILASILLSGCTCLGIQTKESIIEDYEIEIQNMDTNAEISYFDNAMSISNRVIDDQRLRKSDKAYLVNYILIMLKSFEDETK